jgi:hypothetical protein
MKYNKIHSAHIKSLSISWLSMTCNVKYRLCVCFMITIVTVLITCRMQQGSMPLLLAYMICTDVRTSPTVQIHKVQWALLCF